MYAASILGMFDFAPLITVVENVVHALRSIRQGYRVPLTVRNLLRHRNEDAHFFGLTYSHIGIYILFMPRAATTSDAFNAIAEPRRRAILNFLALAEHSVGDIVTALDVEQPSVLLDVGLVRVRRNGRQMLYRTNAEAIRPLHEWASTFERLWSNQLLRVKERAEKAEADRILVKAKKEKP
jgi:DNA-binding transcriptional ArsR family regulator